MAGARTRFPDCVVGCFVSSPVVLVAPSASNPAGNIENVRKLSLHGMYALSIKNVAKKCPVLSPWIRNNKNEKRQR